MKRVLMFIAVAGLISAPMQAQSFLSKLKEKAGEAVGGAVSGVLGDKVKDVLPEGMQDMAQMGETGTDAPQAVTGEQALPPRRASTFGWDGPVAPSSAKFPIPLMNEFPAVPSAAELAHPTEENQIAYYKAIKAVTLRAEELNESTTCEDEETLMWRKKSNKMLGDLFGLTDKEIEMLQDENLPEADKKRLEEKMQKALLGDMNVDDLEKQAARYEKMSDEELAAAMQRGEMNDIMSMANKAGEMRSKMAPIMETEQKMSAYFTQSTKLLQIPDGAVDAKFSAADRKKVQAIKDKIYATDNPSEYNPLYLQALELITSYRERAAQVWAADVQKRFNQLKANMSELIKLNRQAVADELIPECALWRMPLNAVISAGDILAEAYSEFPCDYPPMYLQEVIREVPVSRVPGTEARGWFPEFSVFGASHFDEIAAGRYFFASNAEGEVYQFNAGSWTKLTNERIRELSEMKRDVAPASQSWTSQDGKRKVVYTGEGGYIVLPEGDEIFQPHAWKAFSDKIQWLYQDTTEDGKIQLILCTYKL